MTGGRLSNLLQKPRDGVNHCFLVWRHLCHYLLNPCGPNHLSLRKWSLNGNEMMIGRSNAIGTPPELPQALLMYVAPGWLGVSFRGRSYQTGEKIDPAPGKQTRCPSLRVGQNYHLQCLDTVSVSVISSSLFLQDLLLL